MNRPLVFLDADVIFAGAAAPTQHGASHAVLTLGEMNLIQCLTSTQVVTELERNLRAKLPKKLPELRLILSRSLKVVPDPSLAEMAPCRGQADAKDLPILVAALKYHCSFLLTFNIRDFTPSGSTIRVLRPGEFLSTVRALLVRLEDSDDRI